MGGSGSKTVLNELHGLQERLIDGLAAPELADQRAENARLRALLGDAVRVIGQLRGVDGDDAAAGDAEAKEAAAVAVAGAVGKDPPQRNEAVSRVGVAP